MTRRRGVRESADDVGSATLWVVASVAIIAVIVGAVAVRALAIGVRHRAEAVADTVALAAAAQIGTGAAICPVAATTATASGARLDRCTATLSADGRSGAVTVAITLDTQLPVVGRVTVSAWARAGRDPPLAI